MQLLKESMLLSPTSLALFPSLSLQRILEVAAAVSRTKDHAWSQPLPKKGGLKRTTWAASRATENGSPPRRRSDSYNLGSSNSGHLANRQARISDRGGQGHIM